ncbi:MAG: FAD-dependent oxidoreductase [Mariprofundaceae bacterium]|nr:FAD-dependent oxidoreductase [Mariprofundaceae bacterium]
MTQTLRTDVLIIGAGLAGSLLAWRLIQAGKSVHILHNPKLTSASRVAAGLINPVTGQRLVLQENIEVLLPAAHALYQQLEEQFHTQFFFEKDMLRSLQHDKAKLAWKKRQLDSAYQHYICEIPSSPDVIKQSQTGYLDTNALLDALHGYFQQYNCLTEGDAQQHDIQVHQSAQYHLQWKHITASTVVFCQGWREINNKFFSFLPFQPAKGEILHLSTPNKLPEHIINQGKWLLPLNDGNFKIGATYQSNTNDEQTTEEGKKELLTALKSMPIEQQNITLTNHQAGIRPNTLDKQPFLGMHPKHKNIAIFNGFGSKGSLLIPWYSKSMCGHLIHGTALPGHADIKRFACV